MWSARDDSSEIQEVEPAQLHDSLWRHDAPNTMGEDHYIHGSGAPNNEPRAPPSSDGRSSSNANDVDDSGSATGLRAAGVPMGGVRSRSQAGGSDYDDGGPARAASRAEVLGDRTGSDKDDFAQPIGLLAAMGTTRAKKLIYTSRKCLILSAILGLVLLVIGVVLLVFPILHAVARHTMRTAVFTVSSANMTSPTNTTFGLTLEGQVQKAGVFPGRVSFEQPVEVFWIAPERLDKELHIGQMSLDYIGIAAGHGRIKQHTQFNIVDPIGFARFAEYLITQEAFTWRLKSEEVKIKAFGFIVASGISLVKDVTLNGMANMTHVGVSDFQLPGDDPAGGVSLAATAQFTNPSAFGIEVGTLAVDLYYKDLYLGPAQSARPINLTAGLNNVDLVGRLVPHIDDPEALRSFSFLFSNYLNGLPTLAEARGRSVTLPSGEVISWLSQGIESLTLKINLQSPTGPISAISGLTIEALSLAFDPSKPFAPMANSSEVAGKFSLPFGFSLDIVELENKFSIVSNETIVASLAAPAGLSKTTILTQNAGATTGDITLALPLAPLTVGPSDMEHRAFEQFTYDLATTDVTTFSILGSTTAIANTPLGQVKLTDVRFVVPAGLIGLDGLSAYPTTVLSIDVVGGTPEAVVLALNVGITNPSNVDLAAGNITFQLFAKDSFLGTAVIPDAHLVRGYSEYSAIAYFQANANAEASHVLTNFISSIDTPVTISGFNGSTAVESLTQAFMAIHIKSTLKGLTSKLVNYANLTILPTTGVTNSIANGIVSLQNPFSSELRISNIQSNITHSSGLFVGSIVADTDFRAVGHAASNSPVLALNLNLYPPQIFTLVRVLAVEAGLDTAQLDGMVALAEYSYVPTNGSQARHQLAEKSDTIPLALGYEGSVSEALSPRDLRRRNLYTGFDLPSFALSAFSALKVNVALVAVMHVGDFETDLTYSQSAVPAYTDSSLVLLLPILARPIVQKIVDQALMSVESVLINEPTETSFVAGLVGSISNAGPFDGVIHFTTGLTAAWNGKPLGQIAMPDVSLVGDEGAQLNVAATFAVADSEHLTDFVGYLLNEPSFVWQIYGKDLAVTALGIRVDGISFTKTVVLDGFNGLKGGVIVNSFDLPRNDPAGGVALTLQTTLVNPSSVGMSLSTIGFRAFYGKSPSFLGPISSPGAISLLPKSTTSLTLVGRLITQTTPTGLQDVSTVLNGFIHGVPSELVVRGDRAGAADVSWLNNGIKKLSVAVIFPAMNLQLINSIDLKQMTLMFSKEKPWSPLFSTNNAAALFQLPFAFPVDIIQASMDITASGGGGSRMAKRDSGDFAVASVPLAPSTTDVQSRTLHLQFKDVPLTSTNNGMFSSFLTTTTVGGAGSLGLHGSADAVTATALGQLTLSGIPFTVEAAVEGLQGLNAQPASVTDLDVFHGFKSYLQINANAHLFNPSNQVTIGAGDVAFGLTFQGNKIGTANIANLILAPGWQVLPAQVHYAPSSSSEKASGQLLLENFVQGVPSEAIIIGDSGTTPIDSLKEALATVKLSTTLPPLLKNLVTEARLDFPVDIAKTGVALAQISITNPFTASLVIQKKIFATAEVLGIALGNLSQQNLNPAISAPGHSDIVSSTLPLNLNMDPKALAGFFIAVAAQQNVDLGFLRTSFPLCAAFAADFMLFVTVPELNYILGLPSTESTIKSQINSDPETCDPTGTTAKVKALLHAALQNLKANLTIESVIRLDDYETPLNFKQLNVPTIVSDDVFRLVGIIAKPLLNHIIETAQFGFSGGFANNVTDNGFTVALTGSLLDAGPFDALLEFPEGIDVHWQGSLIANIVLPPICYPGGAGIPDLKTTGILQIKNQGRFTDFAEYLLKNPQFTWTITTDKLRLYALGTIFDDVSFTKNVTLDAFNNFAPGFSVVNADFPGDSSSPAGIMIALNALIPSPSALGLDVGTLNLMASYQGSKVGPLSASGLILQPKSETAAHLTGVAVYRDDEKGVLSLGTVFSQFLAGENTTLSVTGVSVITPAQPDSPVTWLSAAFKRFTLDAVLPGHTYEVISAASLKDLTATLLNPSQDYHALAQNNRTELTVRNPFKFSLTALRAGGTFIMNYNNVDAISLKLPMEDVLSSETSTGNDATVVINIPNPIPLDSLNNKAYENILTSMMIDPVARFKLHGSGNVTAKTPAGNIPIFGIPFNVDSSLPGLNDLGGKANVPATPVVIGSGAGDPFVPSPGGEFVRMTLSFEVNNPAPIVLHTNKVSLVPVYKGYPVGRVILNPFDLYPGFNSVPAEFHYQPADPANSVASEVLTRYLESTGQIPITTHGDLSSSPYGAFAPAASKFSLDASIPGLGKSLIQDLVFYVDIPAALCNNTILIKFRVNNFFKSSFTVLSAKGTGSQNGTEYATYDHTFVNKFVTNAGQTPGDYSEQLPATLTKGTLGSLGLLSDASQKQGIDLVLIASANLEEYNVPALTYHQNNVPYTIVYTGNGAVIGSDPTALIGILESLGTLVQCGVGDALSVIPALLSNIPALLSDLAQIPAFLTSLIGGIPLLPAPTTSSTSAASTPATVAPTTTSSPAVPPIAPSQPPVAPPPPPSAAPALPPNPIPSAVRKRDAFAAANEGSPVAPTAAPTATGSATGNISPVQLRSVMDEHGAWFVEDAPERREERDAERRMGRDAWL